MHAQQPAAESLFHRMEAIAHSRLRNLSKQRMGVADYEIMKLPAPNEFIPESTRFHSQSINRKLDHPPVWHFLRVCDDGNTSRSFISNHADFDDLSRFRTRQKGDDTAQR